MHVLTVAMHGIASLARRYRPKRRWLLNLSLLAIAAFVAVGTVGGLGGSSGGTSWVAHAALAACLVAGLAVPSGRRRWSKTANRGALVAALDAETRRRRAVEAELEAVRQSLDVHVRARTGELERANTALRARQAQLTRLAMHDGLTGLPNRRLFLHLLRQEQVRARRFKGQFALLLADLDRFKPVNDQHGHAAGDLLLLQVAGRLAGAVRASDIVARLGGDEFAILMREPGDDGALAGLMERLLLAVEAPCQLGGRQVSVGLSLGTALYPTDGEDLNTLFEVADQRLYAEKRRRAEPRRHPPVQLAWPSDAGRDGAFGTTSCGSGRA